MPTSVEGTMSGYLDVVATWLAGKPTSGLSLWGHTMFWWGRLGKVLQFAAALVAIVDLLSPNWLRARRDSAGRRARLAITRGGRRRQLRRIMIRRAEIRADFFIVTIHAQGRTRASVTFSVVRVPPARVPRGLNLTLDAYRDHHRRIIDQAADEHPCSDQHESPCSTQQMYLRRATDQLLTEQLPPSQRHLIADADVTEAGGSFGWIVIGFALVLIGGVAQAPLLAVVGIGIIPLMWLPFQVRLWGITQWHRLRGRLEQGLRQEMTGSADSQPFRRLRLLALLLFIVGVHFDLLAS
ncbi:hypothetical protein AB0B57_10160 [Micromonospora sp. NPDC049101]|uniref:hypothetical protein n=1 Tax=unclassified Micromonospora TaxID=2617518 RepID=UPI0033D1B232